jgi:hypothetical protein
VIDDTLSEDARDLLASERRAPAATEGARSRVAARLAVSVTAVPLAVPSRSVGWGPAHAAAIGAAFVLGAAVGVGAALALRPPGRAESPASAPIEASAAAPSAPRSPLAPPVANEPAITAAPPAVPSREAPVDRSIGAEQKLLDPARVALGRGDGAAALGAATAHGRRFPQGQLSEEREAILIQALVLLGRGPEARARADRFVRTYPNSALMPAIREALGPAP